MDNLLIAAGVGYWFGFSMPLFISVLIHAATSLAPLSRMGGKYAFLSATLRITICLATLVGIFGFAAFQGQLSPSKNISGAFTIIGAAIYYLAFFAYRRLATHVSGSNT